MSSSWTYPVPVEIQGYLVSARHYRFFRLRAIASWIAAYALHPVGVILDYLIFRPGHWIGSHEPIRTLVGHPETRDEEASTPHPTP